MVWRSPRSLVQLVKEVPSANSGGLTVDLVRRHVPRDGREMKLSPKEFDLLRHLLMRAGKVLTHRHLLRKMWARRKPHPHSARHRLSACNSRPSSAPEQTIERGAKPPHLRSLRREPKSLSVVGIERRRSTSDLNAANVEWRRGAIALCR
jgi:Transcriptional regulatory protein, C terminal